MPPAAPSIHPAALPDKELLKSCRITRSRSSGPGGQHRNKVETAIRIEHSPTGVMAQATESRSQADNRRHAIRRLRILLAIHHRLPVDPLTYRPSACLVSRTREQRLQLNPRHADFPVLLAEAIDVVSAVHDDLPRAAVLMNLSTSQLLKLLSREPSALAAINSRRQSLGLTPYKARR